MKHIYTCEYIVIRVSGVLHATLQLGSISSCILRPKMISVTHSSLDVLVTVGR